MPWCIEGLWGELSASLSSNVLYLSSPSPSPFLCHPSVQKMPVLISQLVRNWVQRFHSSQLKCQLWGCNSFLLYTEWYYLISVQTFSQRVRKYESTLDLTPESHFSFQRRIGEGLFGIWWTKDETEGLSTLLGLSNSVTHTPPPKPSDWLGVWKWESRI